MAAEDYQRIARAIIFVEENYQDQPDLAAVAAHVGLSEHHLQRLFTRWAGISPKRFLQFITAKNAQQQLRSAQNVLDTAYTVGLSGPGRLHDLTVNVYAMTPGEIKAQGHGLTITYGIHATPFGEALLAQTSRGICHLSFIDASPLNRDGYRTALKNLIQAWPKAGFRRDNIATSPTIDQIFGQASGDLTVMLKGTNFQINVWQALLNIPAGTVSSYGDIARQINAPTASRAVGSAVSRNAIAYLIPCHRVIRNTGAFGDYRWGLTRKRAILAWEQAQQTAAAVPVSQN